MISPQCTLSKTYCNVNHGKKRPYNGYVRSQREICTTQMPPVQCASVQCASVQCATVQCAVCNCALCIVQCATV